ncbi:uncharacterized protein COLE_03137 [Cutaneotrichosporon oleaginosum]|uniref:uncharacterized protein n=1 Tax=Cutaneotrichosporon oleaginosum TaxID=879819 RepID=UPI0013294777|nr:hypothetical protein COLE_03137 [Cutaneotrichosporon oleaginosum]
MWMCSGCPVLRMIAAHRLMGQWCRSSVIRGLMLHDPRLEAYAASHARFLVQTASVSRSCSSMVMHRGPLAAGSARGPSRDSRRGPRPHPRSFPARGGEAYLRPRHVGRDGCEVYSPGARGTAAWQWVEAADAWCQRERAGRELGSMEDMSPSFKVCCESDGRV